MDPKPIKFEEHFSKLKSRLQSAPMADHRLLHLSFFWPHLKPLTDNRSYDSHTAEYLALLLKHCRQENLVDLTAGELEDILAVLSLLREPARRFSLSDDLASTRKTVGIEQATKLFYIGEAESGLRVLRTTLNLKPDPESELMELPPGLDELDTLRLLKEKCGEADDPATLQLRSILRDWEILREETSHTELECLFVERPQNRPIARGRLRTLEATAQYSSGAASSHEVTFEHQIRSPDDLFVGSTYEALTAVTRLLSGSDFRLRRGDFVHAHYHIRSSDHPFTGDSIGLAAALIALVQLLSSEVLRYERGIVTGTAFTGGIDGDGTILPVNSNTLPHKIERTFCSHVKYLVLPRENLEAAQEHLAALQQEHPRRRLKLVPVRQLDEVVRDRNIVRSEKVCPGQYVIRKAHAYSRTGYIQIPLLIVLTYVLVCLLYPKAWLKFDRNPHHVTLNDRQNRIMVYNQDKTLLWSVATDCDPLDGFWTQTCDLDEDGRREIIYLQGGTEAAACSVGTRLCVRDHDGEMMFHRPCNIVGEDEGDSADNVMAASCRLGVYQSKSGPIIVSNIAQNYPGRSTTKIWSSGGDLLGWYVHAGHVRYMSAKDVNGDGNLEILALAINNPMRGFGLFVIPTVGSHGVSPPHTMDEKDARQHTEGNQYHYIFFPSGELTLLKGIPYNCCGEIAILPSGEYRVQIDEDMATNSFRSYFLDDKFRVTSMVPSDIFWSRRKMFAGQGKLPEMTMDEFCRRELEQVLYWTAEGWVSADQRDQ